MSGWPSAAAPINAVCPRHPSREATTAPGATSPFAAGAVPPRAAALSPDDPERSRGVKADAAHGKTENGNRRRAHLHHYSASARPVLSPSVSIGTPTLSSIDRIRFVIGV